MRTTRLVVLLTLLVHCTVGMAKSDWQSDMRKWAVSNDTNAACKIYYVTGIYEPGMGNQPAWGMWTQKMFKWFSRDGVRLAPSVCPVSRNTKGKAAYRILFSVSPMKTVSQTTHGSETQTVDQPFSANVNSRTTYPDGSTAYGTATINGQQSTTVVVPTETTISQSSVDVYMYTYRVNGGQLELIGSDSVVFSRVVATGSGENAAGTEIGAGIGNLIRASGDRHRADKLYEEALKAILADAPDNAAQPSASPKNHVSDAAAAPTTSGLTAPATLNSEVLPMAQTKAILPECPASPEAERAACTSIEQDAANGDPLRQLAIGGIYESGNKYVRQDYSQAVIWYRKAAEQGFAEAQGTLGFMYERGHGVPQDYAQAEAWYRKAADQGDALAQWSLGALYEYGHGIPQDYAESYFWLDVAASEKIEGVKQEDVDKSRDDAASHLTPADLSREQERARKWFEDHPAKPQ